MTARRLLVLGGLGLALLIAAQPVFARPAAAPALIERISTGSSPQGGGGSYAILSSDGRFVAFESAALDLLPGKISDSWDTLVRDRQLGATERVSTQPGGQAIYNPGDYTSPPSLSADGRLVAFMSQAELTPNDNNGMPDIYLHNRQTGETRLVSVAPNGQSGNADSYNPVLSENGRYVVFQSHSSNLVSGDTNNSLDVFVRDLQTGTTERVSVTSTGGQGSDWHDYGFSSLGISADGRYVTFSYENLPAGQTADMSTEGVYLRDRQAPGSSSAATTRRIADGTLPALTPNGRYLAFVSSAALLPADTNGADDVYLIDGSTNQLELISVPVSGADAPNAHILSEPALSDDGRFVAFETTARLSAEDTNEFSDIYLRDRQNGTTTLISAGQAGPADGESHGPSLSTDGQVIVAFNSLATNLVPGDENGRGDVFVATVSLVGAVVGEPSLYLPMVTR